MEGGIGGFLLMTVRGKKASESYRHKMLDLKRLPVSQEETIEEMNDEEVQNTFGMLTN